MTDCSDGNAMRVLDRALGEAGLFFAVGVVSAALVVLALPGFREMAVGLIQFRMLEPVRAVSAFGNLALLVLIFLNNSIPVALSFAYPALIAKLDWSPPLSVARRRILLDAFTILTAFLLGFFSVGTPLAVFWVIRGSASLLILLTGAWLHSPIEITVVLLCVSESARLSSSHSNEEVLLNLQGDLKLMFSSFLVLFGAAVLESLLGL